MSDQATVAVSIDVLNLEVVREVIEILNPHIPSGHPDRERIAELLQRSMLEASDVVTRAEQRMRGFPPKLADMTDEAIWSQVRSLVADRKRELQLLNKLRAELDRRAKSKETR